MMITKIQINSLRRQSVRNRIYDRQVKTVNWVILHIGKDGDCMYSGTICLILCNSWDEHIGKTFRPLCVCMKKHSDMVKPQGFIDLLIED